MLNSDKAKKAWDAHSDDLIPTATAGEKANTKAARTKLEAALLAAQKLKSAEMLKVGKEVSKSLATLAKQEKASEAKAAKLNDLISLQKSLEKELRTLRSPKEKAKANKVLEKNAKAMADLEDELEEMSESLQTSLGSFHEELSELEENIKYSTSAIGKDMLKQAQQLAEKQEKQDIQAAKKDSKILQEIFGKQLEKIDEEFERLSHELETTIDDSESKLLREEHKNLADLYKNVLSAKDALANKNYKAYLAEQKKIDKNNSNVSSKLNIISERVQAEHAFKAERSAKRWDMAEGLAGKAGLSNVFRMFRPSEDHGNLAEKYSDKLGLSNIYKGVKSLSSVAGSLRSAGGSAKPLPASVGLGKDAAADEEEARATEEEFLLRRQVKALEEIAKKPRTKTESSGSDSASWLSKIKDIATSAFDLATGPAGQKLLSLVKPLMKLGLFVSLLTYSKDLDGNNDQEIRDKWDSPEKQAADKTKTEDRRAQLAEARKNGTAGQLMEKWRKEDTAAPTPEAATSLAKAAAQASAVGGGRGVVNPASANPIGGGRGNVNPEFTIPEDDTSDAGGSTLSEAKGKLFQTSKSGDSLDMVNPAVQSNFTAMAAEYKSATGKDIQLNSGYRSAEEQAALYAADPSKAAPPGKSAHGFGLALDVNSADANDLDKMGLLSKYGFSRPVSGEKWHLQAAGSAAALAKSGAYSADSASDQNMARSGKSTPVTATVPPAPQVQTSSATEGSSASSSAAGGGGGSSSKGSTQTIPTFSYMDGGMFILNTGMMTS